MALSTRLVRLGLACLALAWAPVAWSLDHIEMRTAGAGADAPVVVLVHGYGDRPEGISGLLQAWPTPARVLVPRGPTPMGQGAAWFPRGLDSSGDALGHAADLIAAFITSTAPPSRPIIITGFSQGGMLSFAVAVRHPELISAAVPISGWLPPGLWPDECPPESAPPIHAFHGEADTVLPLGPTADAVSALAGLGWDATLRTYPGVPHRIPEPMRSDVLTELAVQVAAAR